MKLYRVTRYGKTERFSPEPVLAEDVDESNVIEIVEVDTPEVEGVIQYWDGSDGKKYPHLHYVCPRCGLGQNVDLLADEPDPRFACCDRCSWDSMVWIRWRNGPTAT